MKDVEDDIETDVDWLAACRAALGREGEDSSTARAIFRQFYDSWRAEVERRAIAKLGSTFYAEDLVHDTFEMIWKWVNGSSGLPKPSTLINTCLTRAYANQMRTFHGRQDLPKRSTEQDEKYIPGSDPRFPLSTDYADEDLRTLIDALADDADVELEVLLHEEWEVVRQGLAALPPHYRACLVCRYDRRLSVSDTCLETGYTYDQVTKYTAAGLARLTVFVLEALSE